MGGGGAAGVDEIEGAEQFGGHPPALAAAPVVLVRHERHAG
ncbi:hypothetical protein [Streptomyces sp. NBC_00829]